MDAALEAKILDLLREHRIMTVATNRPDGWPQATTVGYVSDGLTLWFLCGPDSQKAHNLAHDNRISLTIDHDCADPMQISGLSMAARAIPADTTADKLRMFDMLRVKYPEYANYPAPELDQIKVFRVVPEVISVLDYTKGFAHTDLVTV